MPTQHTFFQGGLSAKKFRATVIHDIWPEVLFFSSIATVVSLITRQNIHDLSIPNNLLTVLGLTLGLVISFRTSSAYERYQDGRKMWTNLQFASRNLAQLIWIHIPLERVDKDEQKAQSNLESVIEKKSMINLVQAFSVSIKHFLRGEVGVYYEDLYPLISFLPRYINGAAGQSGEDTTPLWHTSENGQHTHGHFQAHNNGGSASNSNEREKPHVHEDGPRGSFGRNRVSRAKSFDPEAALADVPSDQPLKPARSLPKTTVYDYLPILLIFRPIIRFITKFRLDSQDSKTRDVLGRRRRPQLGDSNVPLEITLYLSNYIGYVMRAGLVQSAVATNLMSNLHVFQDTLQNLERIGNTPLPFAYQAHLRLSVWLYLLFLPFQIVDPYGYLTIPGTAFASFLLIGFLEIGQQIENPFQYDLNDLDIDDFCLTIGRELHEVTVHTNDATASFVFSGWNQPFAPGDRRTAEQIISLGSEYRAPEGDSASQPGIDSVRATLLKSWKEIDEVTRHYKKF